MTDWAIDPAEEGKLVIRAEDTLIGVVRRIPVDMVVLSVGLEPQADAEDVRRMFNITCASDGWFLERHPKLAPVTTFTDGIFLAGACQGPEGHPRHRGPGRRGGRRGPGPDRQGLRRAGAEHRLRDDEELLGLQDLHPAVPLHRHHLRRGRRQGRRSTRRSARAAAPAWPPARPGSIQQHLFTDEQIFEEIEGVLTYV